MKSGDIVRNKKDQSYGFGLFIGNRVFESVDNIRGHRSYTAAQVMWFDKKASNGSDVSTIFPDLLEVVDEIR